MTAPWVAWGVVAGAGEARQTGRGGRTGGGSPCRPLRRSEPGSAGIRAVGGRLVVSRLAVARLALARRMEARRVVARRVGAEAARGRRPVGPVRCPRTAAPQR
jgi:hypothetical protein